MARVEVRPDEVVVRLSALEKVGGLSRDVHIPRSAVTSASYRADVFDEKRGLRVGGTSIPKVIRLGHFVVRGATEFLAIHGPHTGVVLELDGHRYGRVVVSLPEPAAHAVVDQLT